MSLCYSSLSLLTILAYTGNAMKIAHLREQVSQPETEVSARNWISSYYTLIKVQQDPLLNACCSMAKNLGIQPWMDWGAASPEDKQWWEEMNCNSAVGADQAELVVGTPNCVQVSVLSSLVPTDLKPAHSSLFRSVSQCTTEDRMQINNTFLGIKQPHALTPECSPTEIISNRKSGWDTLATCSQKLLGVSFPCASCYSNVMRSLIASDGPPTGCIHTCYALEACAALKYCVPQSRECATCIQPKVNTYLQCMGGPVENQLNVEDIMRRMVHVWGSGVTGV